MKSRFLRLLIAASVAALLTSACNVNPQQASQAAERVMTVAAQITPEAMETAMASSPVGTPVSAGPVEAPVIYARCITRGATALLQLPQDGAAETAQLSSRSIITTYGRTVDATWVLGWDAREVHGWLPARDIGCTAPMEDLRITDAGVMLTPTAAVVAEMMTGAKTEATAEVALEAEATAGITATTTINAVTATPAATLEPTVTEAPAATATEAPIATETVLPTVVPLPTALPTRTTLPAATRSAATATPASPVRVITVVVLVTTTPAQVRDLRCTVTPGTPVNLRNGPARGMNLLDTLPAGTRFLAQGRNEDATWLYGFTERQMPGWLIASSVECDGDPAQLVEVDR